MRLPVVSPDKFAEWFNSVVPGAYRKIIAQDIRDLTKCGLIGRYGQYYRADLETVRATLLYELLRDERERKACLKDAPKTCKRCDQPLSSQPNGRRGRPSEYCLDCEPFRGRERYGKWRNRQTALY